MSDVKCPYCGGEQEINHDDGYGYGEDEMHEQECSDCDMYFTFTTSISFHYDTAKAACLNGAKHRLKAGFCYPIEFTKMRCEDCDYQRPMTRTELVHQRIRMNVMGKERSQ